MPKVTWNGMRISDPQTDLSPPLLHKWSAPVLTMLAVHASPMKPVAVGASSALNRAMQESENSLPAPSCGWFPQAMCGPVREVKPWQVFFFFEFIWMVAMEDVSGARPPTNAFLTCQADR